MDATIEFTDRYGGAFVPLLRICRGQCEGMGTYPNEGPIPPGAVKLSDDDLPGWCWVRCEECGGSGRVSRLIGLGRLPRWVLGNARFVWHQGVRGRFSERWTRWQTFKLAVRCCHVTHELRSLLAA